MNKIARNMFPKSAKKFDEKKCVFCNKKIDIKDFENEISKKEYAITGVCQTCQDKTFK